MVLQKQKQGGTEAAPGQTAGAAMTGRATIRKQTHCRFALINILTVCRSAEKRINSSEDEQTAAQFFLSRHELRWSSHVAVVLHRQSKSFARWKNADVPTVALPALWSKKVKKAATRENLTACDACQHL